MSGVKQKLESIVAAVRRGDGDEALRLLGQADQDDDNRRLLRIIANVQAFDPMEALELLGPPGRASGLGAVLEARVSLENRDLERCRAALAQFPPGQEAHRAWLEFAASLVAAGWRDRELESLKRIAHVLVDDSFTMSALESNNSEDSEAEAQANDGVRAAFEQLPEASDLRSIMQVVACLARLESQKRLAPRDLANELLALARLLKDVRQQGKRLRARLLIRSSEILARLGEGPELRARLQEIIAFPAQESAAREAAGIWDTLTWAVALKESSAPESEVLELARWAQTLAAKNQHSEDWREAALLLARLYAEYGYTIEARSLLHSVYERGHKNKDLIAGLRHIIFVEAFGLKETTGLAFEGLSFEDIDMDLHLPPLQKDRFELLFFKAQECYKKLGANHGGDVLSAARTLKACLKDKDFQRALRYEERLAQIVTRIQEEA